MEITEAKLQESLENLIAIRNILDNYDRDLRYTNLDSSIEKIESNNHSINLSLGLINEVLNTLYND